MLAKFTKVKFPWAKIFFKPLLSALIMGIVTIIVYKLVFAFAASNLLAVGVAIIVAVPLYGILIVKTRAIQRDEIMSISIGRKIAKICDKLHLW